jgi:hypothetical protein
VPMHELRHVGVVVDIDHRPPTFLKADQRPRELPWQSVVETI